MSEGESVDQEGLETGKQKGMPRSHPKSRLKEKGLERMRIRRSKGTESRRDDCGGETRGGWAL